MAEADQKAKTGKKLTRKQAKKEVFDKLSGALAEYRATFDEKTFDNKLKKASKLFAVDIYKAAKKKVKKAVSARKKK